MITRVLPYRFSNDPPAMVAFLETLGLAREVSAPDGGFAVLGAASGGIGVHHVSADNAAGETHLVLEVASADDLAGLEGIVVWDEAWGKQAGITDPLGGGIWLDEVQTDLYGYVEHHGTPRDGLVVDAIRFSTDFAADQAFFARFGLLPAGHRDEYWTPLQASRESGTLALHRNTGEAVTRPAPDNPVGDHSLCILGFETSEPLAQVCERLVAAGHPATLVEGPRRAVHVADPDGQEIQIHELS